MFSRAVQRLTDMLKSRKMSEDAVTNSPTLSLSPPSPFSEPFRLLESPRHTKRTPVPLLLEAFPVPPSHIPSPSILTPSGTSPLHSPLGKPNPPPTLPPSSPLPPIPGPSPITEHEALFFKTSTRSRRGSKISIASSIQSAYTSTSPPVSRPSSIATSATSVTNSNTTSPIASAPSGTTASHMPRRNSVASARSIHSFSSSGSLSAPTLTYARSPSYGENPPSVAYPISEEDPSDLTRVDMEGLHSISPMPPLSDMEDTDRDNILKGTPPLSRNRSRHRPSQEDSIASINMSDLPADDEAGELDADTKAQAVHRQMRSNRSRSEKHKQLLRSRSTSPRRSSSRRIVEEPVPVPPLPQQYKRVEDKVDAPRPNSPDIATILANTPRPRRRQSSFLSGSSSRSASNSRPATRTGIRRRVSEGTTSALSTRTSVTSGLAVDAADDLDTWENDSFVSDYGVPIDSHIAGRSRMSGGKIEKDLNDSDSDSSLDLHTPLPHLMLRHGLLSPKSKLLPPGVRSSSPTRGPDNRPGSVASTSGSIMTKLGVFKDERDTPTRRVRHRDGRLLRGGIGLTTGLGWSDSEDEDAPSPLTRRISSLNLSRPASASSLRTSAHPLSRSFSGGIWPEENDRHPPPLTRSKSRPSLPPTSWPKRPVGHTSIGSVTSSLSASSAPVRGSIVISKPPKSEVDVVRTPSTTSTRSLPTPVTPERPDQFLPSRAINKDKSLPPLPALRKYPSGLSLRPLNVNGMEGSGLPQPRQRTMSSSSSMSMSSAGATIDHGTSKSTPATPITPSLSESRIAMTPRPLHLPQAQGLRLQPGEQYPRPGQLLTYNRNLHDQQRMRATSGPPRSSFISRMPSSPPPPMPSAANMAAPAAKPKPRTGTGMVYRTSVNPGSALASRIRMPNAPSASLSSLGRGPYATVVSPPVAF